MIINLWSAKVRIIEIRLHHLLRKKKELIITFKKKVRNSRITHKEMKTFEMIVSFL